MIKSASYFSGTFRVKSKPIITISLLILGKDPLWASTNIRVTWRLLISFFCVDIGIHFTNFIIFCKIDHMYILVDTLGNKVEIRKIKATGSADRDFLVIYSGHG